jgi:hypothetical protein
MKIRECKKYATGLLVMIALLISYKFLKRCRIGVCSIATFLNTIIYTRRVYKVSY